MWWETDGTQVWLVAGSGRGLIVDLRDRERRASTAAEPGAVLGANALSDDRVRITQLEAHGYSRTFSMVRLERDTAPIAARRPTGVDVREVEPADATAMHELTQTVWGDRSYFMMPSIESYRAWVRESDPALFLLAGTSDGLAGYVATFEQQGELVIDDIQVGPARRRQGIGTFLLARILTEARRRRIGRVHLETEGDDPVGARAFYEQLGFSSAGDDLRFRKSVALATRDS